MYSSKVGDKLTCKKVLDASICNYSFIKGEEYEVLDIDDNIYTIGNIFYHQYFYYEYIYKYFYINKELRKIKLERINGHYV